MPEASLPSQSLVLELRDPIHGPIPVRKGEIKVIDAPLFQRLRGVKQLGFAEYVFPGAVHNRYLHSIGAMHLAGRVFDALEPSLGALDRRTRVVFRQLVRLAALLHDIGHAPLSHAAESLMPMRRDMGLSDFGVGAEGKAEHEEMSLKIVADSALSAVIDTQFEDLGVGALHVARVLGARSRSRDVSADFVVGGVDYLPLLKGLVAGELDVDRMDYLLRDSYFAGVSYGRYDLDWLLSNLLAIVDADTARVGIRMRAVTTFEHFLLARYHMFQMVYFHPKSDIYDEMLRQWLRSVGDEARFPADPDAYVECTDAWLIARLRASDDAWARRIRELEPLKMLRELRDEAARATHETLDRALREADLHPTWITSKPVLSRYAQSPAHLRENPVFVRDQQSGRDRDLRIEEVTDLFGRYEQTKRIERLYVLPEERARAREVLERIP